MSFNDIEKKKIEKTVESFLEKRRPPIEIRDKVDIGFKIDKYSIEIFEIRPIWDKPKEKINIPVAKTTYIKSKNILAQI